MQKLLRFFFKISLGRIYFFFIIIIIFGGKLEAFNSSSKRRFQL